MCAISLSREPQAFWLQESGIRRIRISDLFGQFTYNLTSPFDSELESARVLLLYGDNGSGKTTILRLLFFVLSHIDKSGHKTQIRKIRFRTFEIDFSTGFSVNVTRNNYREEGFTISVYRGGTLVASARYFEDELKLEEHENLPRELIIAHYNRQQEHEHNHLAVLEALKHLDLRMIYVTDKRNTFTTLSEVRQSLRQNRSKRRREIFREDEEEQGDSEPITLSGAVDHISSWATRKAFDGSSQGESDVNTIYADIIEKLAHPTASTALQKPDVGALISELNELSERSLGFVRFGLSKPLKVERIVKTLSEAEDHAKQAAIDILTPYVTSLQARFSALEAIRIQLAQFVEIISSFYSNKIVSLDISHGLQILAPTDEIITPSMLSSGEGQLLFVLASTLIAKERSSLFLIDEPEISLNVNWQRKLVDALLDMTYGTKIQFLMATHSIELLTKYRQFVLELDNIGGMGN